MLIVILVFAWLLTKAVHDGRVDHEYAKQGLVSPRLERKYGSKEEANARIAKYGLLDHLRDATRDYWARRTDAVVAARDAKASEPGVQVRWRDRLAAARRTVGGGRHRADQSSSAEPAPEPSRHEPAAQATATSQSGHEPAEVDPPVPTEENMVDPLDLQTRIDDEDEAAPTNAQPVSQPANPTPNGGTPMSAPTGEVLNYETAIAEIDAEIEEVQKQVDSAQAAKASLAEAKANVDAMQRNYQATAQAAQSKLDHEAALGLDSTTLGHAGTTVDALPPNAVDALYEQIESMEAEVGDRLKQSETALGSLEAERKHLVETYGEEAGKVASHLGGDPTFLGSGGQTSTPNQPEPVGASR